MTDTVYIVIDEDDYEYRDVTCVFSNREDAEKYVAAGTTTAEELYGPVERPLCHPEIQGPSPQNPTEGKDQSTAQELPHDAFPIAVDGTARFMIGFKNLMIRANGQDIHLLPYLLAFLRGTGRNGGIIIGLGLG